MLGYEIKQKRKEKGLGLRELARKLAISQTYLKDIEDHNRPMPANLATSDVLAWVVDKSKNELIDEVARDRRELPLDIVEAVMGDWSLVDDIRRLIREREAAK